MSAQSASDLDSGGDFSSLPEALDAFERQLLQQALKRCNTTYEIHLDVLTNLKRISSHVTALVYPILEEEP
jgi:Na+/phosphate symporter